MLFSENKMCGITHYDNILTERIRGTNMKVPEITPGYKEVFEKYNREENSKYKDIMGKYFKEVLYHEQPEVNPKIQEPYVIQPRESVLLAVDFCGGFSESEPHGWLADVFDQDAKKEPSLLIDARYAQHGEAVVEEPSDAKVGDAGKDDKAKEKETETQENAGHPTEADGAPTPKEVPQETEAAAEPNELPNSNVKKISFTDVLNKLVGKIRSLSVEDKPNAAILFMGCCRGIGGLIE